MIIVSDAHVGSDDDKKQDFFEMLSLFEKSHEDLLFLGDIFDLWVSIKRFENSDHLKFLKWCSKEKGKRMIGFIEGNHEFFLKEENEPCFSWVSKDHFQIKETYFAHGDEFNQKDYNYLRFKKFSKNPFSKFLLKWLPGAPALANYLKQKLKHTNQAFKKELPIEEIRSYCQPLFQEGIRTIIGGHFHQNYKWEGSEEKKFFLLPPWLNTGLISQYNFEKESLKSFHYQEYGKKFKPLVN